MRKVETPFNERTPPQETGDGGVLELLGVPNNRIIAQSDLVISRKRSLLSCNFTKFANPFPFRA